MPNPMEIISDLEKDELVKVDARAWLTVVQAVV